MFTRLAIFTSCSFLLASCSPLKTHPEDQLHQIELTLQEMQTNLDDARHDMHCFNAEMQILATRLENAEQKTDLRDKNLEKIASLALKIQKIEKNLSSMQIAKQQEDQIQEKLQEFTQSASTALMQMKERIEEMEIKVLDSQKASSQTNGLAYSKNSSQYTVYQVLPKDSLEKIARLHHVSVDQIKNFNQLSEDKILAGQKLRIPLVKPRP